MVSLPDVNDICYGADTVDETFGIQAELTSALGGVSFELRKWASNKEPVLQAVPAKFRVVKSTTFTDDEGRLRRYEDTKVFGLSWHAGGYYFGSEYHLDTSIVFYLSVRSVCTLDLPHQAYRATHLTGHLFVGRTFLLFHLCF